MTNKEVLQQALDALLGYKPHLLSHAKEQGSAIIALREAIAQPVRPPATRPANSQDWAGMDGATAFHLIERHSDNWSDAHMMMDEWRLANPVAQPVQPPIESDFKESVWLMLSSIGYTEDYALQWPKEKVSITFKRWFDEQIENAKLAQPVQPKETK